MEKVLFSEQTIAFTKSAVEFCLLVEKAKETNKAGFVDRATKLLPFLYLSALMMPEMDEYNDSFLEVGVTEEKYLLVQQTLADLLGEEDLFLETFHPDMPYSDTPVVVKISEYMADIYQDLGNFIAVFQLGYTETMNDSLYLCLQNFKEYWGQKVVNVLRALHYIRNNNEISE